MPLHGLRARVRSLWRGVRGRGQFEAEMAAEFEHHLELRTRDLMREGLPHSDAARQARLEFGHLDGFKEDARASRGLRFFDELGFSWLDVKLGLRMLARYPGLSVVSVIGMAMAIAIGTGAFTFVSAVLDPSLPLHEGERLVSIQNADARDPGSPDRQATHDFALWRDRLTTVRDLGAWTADSRTLVLPGGRADLVSVAYMTVSGFRAARVAPALGRPLLEQDERAGAPPVLVIAHEEWQQRFGGDTAILGRPVRLGRTEHLVVGVMPPGFRFPLNFRFWAPLRLDPAVHALGEGPDLQLFARLAPGATIETARAEIAAVGPAEPAQRPHLRPQVLPYAHPFFEIDDPTMALALRAIQLAISLLLVVVAVNVAVLVHARTAARSGEIAVRTALGATRRRVVTQLFAEALVLSAIAAAIGLGIARAATATAESYIGSAIGDELPFWLDFGLTPAVVMYVLGLALLASVIVGVLPALQATGRNVQGGLQQLATRGSRMQLGRTWAVMVVAQVAIAVAVLPYASYTAWQCLRRGTVDARYPVDEIVRAYVALEHDWTSPVPGTPAHDSAMNALFIRRADELVRRLEQEPAVAGVAFADNFPGEEGFATIEIEDGTTEPVRLSRVDVGLLGTFGIPVQAGRALSPGDVRPGVVSTPGSFASAGRRTYVPRALDREEATAGIINTTLSGRLGQSGAVLGRRIRLVRRFRDEQDEMREERGPWIEVAGVMPEVAVQEDIFDPPEAKLYLPASLAGIIGPEHGMTLAVRVRGPAEEFARRFRQIAATVDPALQLHDIRTAANIQSQMQTGLRLTGLGVAAATASVLLLSAAGIYAMLSFTVARRRREIGIRSALGADARRVLGGIFSRVAAQLGLGVLVGILVAAAIARLTDGTLLGGERLLLLPTAAVTMVVIGLVAALGPARRGLAVQPTEALREE